MLNKTFKNFNRKYQQIKSSLPVNIGDELFTKGASPEPIRIVNIITSNKNNKIQSYEVIYLKRQHLGVCLLYGDLIQTKTEKLTKYTGWWIKNKK